MTMLWKTWSDFVGKKWFLSKGKDIQPYTYKSVN